MLGSPPSILKYSLFLRARLIVAVVLAGWSPSSTTSGDEREVFFEQKIRPVLVEHCYSCHSIDSKPIQGNLRLDAKEPMLTGGDSGPAIAPGNVDESLLIEALRYNTMQMPPKGKLPDQVIDDFARWIESGAFDPRLDTTPLPPSAKDDYREQHWSFQSRVQSKLPDIAPATDAPHNNPIDLWIQSKLSEKGLSMAPSADRYTLLRRLSFDLRGLPPSLEEIESFVSDEDPQAIEKVVDKFLSSPSYGERWGRHWLDLARYADSNGADENHSFPVAWRYRDYVVAAWNQDLPFDDFVRQQLAGDLLPYADEEERRKHLTATGFLVIGPKMLAEQDKPKMVADIVDEQVDTVGLAFLGLTLGCARCHDHKFDPITARDYYSLAGIFHSTKTMENLDFVSKWNEVELPDPVRFQQIADYQKRLDFAKQHIQTMAAEVGKPESEWTIQERQNVVLAKSIVADLEKNKPTLDRAMGVLEGKIQSVPIAKRGNHLQPVGDPIARSFPTIFVNTTNFSSLPEQSSGRLQLAEWLVDSNHPLTSRVVVNRLWRQLFGTGLVKTPSNFGIKGETPSHPELLDWLADELIRNDWSIKHIQRTIVLSQTYQMVWRRDSQAELLDPENRLHWRHNRRRLEIEPLRDTMLQIADNLDHKIGGQAESIYGSTFESSGLAKSIHDASRRTLYLPINRAALHELYSTFDYVDSSVSVGNRASTTVPHQSLFVMNSPFALEQAHRIADRSMPGDTSLDNAIERLYLKVLNRPPRASELALAQHFLSTSPSNPTSVVDPQAWRSLCRALIATQEFMTVD